MISSFISLISMFSAEQILQLNNVICDFLVQLVLFQSILDLELLDIPTHESVREPDQEGTEDYNRTVYKDLTRRVWVQRAHIYDDVGGKEKVQDTDDGDEETR
jgi:hypothetical protein